MFKFKLLKFFIFFNIIHLFEVFSKFFKKVAIKIICLLYPQRISLTMRMSDTLINRKIQIHHTPSSAARIKANLSPRFLLQLF